MPKNFDQDLTAVDIRNVLLIDDTRDTSILIEQNGKRFWLPRSQVGYIRKHPASAGGQSCDLKISQWIYEQKDGLRGD